MIRGERVLLRPLTPEDYPRMLEFKNDIELELLGGDVPRPRTLAQQSEFYNSLAKDSNQANFAIEADGKLIGDCGLHGISRLNGTAELGIVIGDRAYWGAGYGREAVQLLVDYGFRMQNLRKVTLSAFASNERAIRSYLAVGFVEEGRQRAQFWSDGGYEDQVLMAIFRDPPS
jgi:RimJ/RimL family protein N-acetyltransferase